MLVTGCAKQFADMLLIGRGDSSAPKHIIALAASSSARDVGEHYARALVYMAAHTTRRGACITFTAVSSAEVVALVGASMLAWPTAQQLADGLVAIHVVHDLAWTTARVLSQQSGAPGSELECRDVPVELSPRP